MQHSLDRTPEPIVAADNVMTLRPAHPPVSLSAVRIASNIQLQAPASRCP